MTNRALFTWWHLVRSVLSLDPDEMQLGLSLKSSLLKRYAIIKRNFLMKLLLFMWVNQLVCSRLPWQLWEFVKWILLNFLQNVKLTN